MEKVQLRDTRSIRLTTEQIIVHQVEDNIYFLNHNITLIYMFLLRRGVALSREERGRALWRR